MAKVFTVAEMQSMVLDRINKIKKLSTVFTQPESVDAYDAAVRECGFSVPVTGDDDINLKNEWLIKRMGFWFYYMVRERHLLLVDSGDIKASEIVKNLTKILDGFNAEFEKAKTSDTTSFLFTEAGNVFGSDPMVLPSGFVNDSIGEDITTYDTSLLG